MPTPIIEYKHAACRIRVGVMSAGGLTYWEVTSNHGVGIFLSFDIDTNKCSCDVIQQYFRPSRAIAVIFACYLVVY